MSSVRLTPAMRFYDYWRSSSAWRVRIALAHKGLPYIRVPVNIAPGKSEQRGPEYSAKNPMRQVPLLEFEDGRALSQSLAIIELLEALAPSPPLLPSDPWLCARARMLAEIVNSGTQPLQNLALQQEIKALGGDEIQWSQKVIAQGLGALEAGAAPTAGEYLVGDAVSIADVLLVPQLYNARRFSVPLDPYPTLRAVEARCAELPAFSASHPDRMTDAPSK